MSLVTFSGDADAVRRTLRMALKFTSDCDASYSHVYLRVMDGHLVMSATDRHALVQADVYLATADPATSPVFRLGQRAVRELTKALRVDGYQLAAFTYDRRACTLTVAVEDRTTVVTADPDFFDVSARLDAALGMAHRAACAPSLPGGVISVDPQLLAQFVTGGGDPVVLRMTGHGAQVYVTVGDGLRGLLMPVQIPREQREARPSAPRLLMAGTEAGVS